MLTAVLPVLRERPEMQRALDSVAARRHLILHGVSGTHAAAVLAEIQATSARPLAIAVPATVDLEVFLLDVRAFHRAVGGQGLVVAFPDLDVNPYGTVPPHDDIVRERLQTLDRCLRGRVDMLLAPTRAWLERIQAPEEFRTRSLHLDARTAIEPGALARHLVASGYRRVSLVESLGEFAMRGGIVDVFPPTHEHPVRIEFFDDEIESLREFNPRDQRSMREIERIDLPPAHTASSTMSDTEAGGEGTATGSRAPVIVPPEGEAATLADYVAEPLWVEFDADVLDSEAEARRGWLDEHYHQALALGVDAPLPDRYAVDADRALRRGPNARVKVQELVGAPLVPGDDGDGGPAALSLVAQTAPSYRGRLADLAVAVRRELDSGGRILIALGQVGKAERLAEILEDYGVPVALDLGDAGDAAGGSEVPEGLRELLVVKRPEALPPGTCWITCADISSGFRVPSVGLWVASDHEIFGRMRTPGRTRRFHGEAFQGDFGDLRPGDVVLHDDQGIGRFTRVKALEIGGASLEFMEIEYRGGDRLYLPLDQLHLVQKFRGGEGAKPKIDKLGGTSWARVKTRVKRSLREMASELLELYAARKALPGYAFGADTPWQRELEDAFEYDETPDQLTAIAEVKRDMESARPMDRLLCGDVGYGKTEVAIRAAFKAVMDGSQVAFLAPTTVLAHQHWRTLQERLAAFPVRVELLSRFRSPTATRELRAGLRDGKVDIVVGTHRLLSKDVRFQSLVLLVVDEEQRFGVTQKERLKALKRQVDVLSMTATPIPRTLQMSLLGVRDLSLIETAPKDRYAIATHIVPFDREVIAAGVREEIGRGGQVFFVHNRIQSIYALTAALRDLVPEARYRVGHGQLPKSELERVMLDFVEGRADVLVSTTIIENGLDIPMANTIFVHRADRFGLAQLYQLRGRVGRSNRRAYAYLIVPPGDLLTPVARKRLRAIQEFSELGSGFRLAAMDLEIRGAGSLLGERQHGQIAAVGFEMYARLLEEAVRELQGEPVSLSQRAQLNLGVELQVPTRYVEDPLQRLMIAKRLASATRTVHLDALRDELRDRYGAMPSVAETLFRYAELRIAAEASGVISIDRRGERVALRYRTRSPGEIALLVERVSCHDAWSMEPPDRLVVNTQDTDGDDIIGKIEGVLQSLSEGES